MVEAGKGRVTPEWGGNIFYLQNVWSLWRKEVGVWKAESIEYVVLLVG